MKSNIYFIGFMGTGKSTVSRCLAELIQYQELDADHEISQRKNMKIPEIFEKYGEAYFRDLETAYLQEMQKKEKTIVSCGGGMVLRKKNVKLMKKNGVIVLLTAVPQTILERVRYGKDRPILNGHMNVEYIEELMEKRRTCYEEAKDLEIQTDGKTPKEIALELKKKLENLKFYFDF